MTIEYHSMSGEIKDLAAALSAAQGIMESARKSNKNEAFKKGGVVSKYADLDDCWDAIRGPLSKNGLSIVQMPSTIGKELHIATLLLHISGQWIKSTLTVPIDGLTAHGVGKAITYGRRFSLMAILGITGDEDDDGNSATAAIDPAFAAKQALMAKQAERQAVAAAKATVFDFTSENQAAWLASKVDARILESVRKRLQGTKIEKDSLEKAVNDALMEDAIEG